jgi:hypothetical protein
MCNHPKYSLSSETHSIRESYYDCGPRRPPNEVVRNKIIVFGKHSGLLLVSEFGVKTFEAVPAHQVQQTRGRLSLGAWAMVEAGHAASRRRGFQLEYRR